MSRARLASVAAGMIVAAGLVTWLTAAEHQGTVPSDFAATFTSPTESAPTALAVRNDAFQRARIYLDPTEAELTRRDPIDEHLVSCRFAREDPSGTTPKFTCVLEDGEQIKVKYGRNPEIQAEAAATWLLHLLGLPTDLVTIVPTVRCYGCPRFPFLTMRILSLARATDMLGAQGYDEGYTDFEWAGVERRFPARTIETDTVHGWAWWELKSSHAPHADIDALRLLAVFLAHWDNKSGNQRLVCLDEACARPMLMIQDLGATFGPEKVNLVRWRDLPIWDDRRTCTVSMRTLPYQGATFPAVAISEGGRLQLARQLSSIDDDQIRELFARARFPEYYSGTDDRRDLDAWTAAFKHRVEQISGGGPCVPAPAPATSSRESFPSRPSPGSSSEP